MGVAWIMTTILPRIRGAWRLGRLPSWTTQEAGTLTCLPTSMPSQRGSRLAGLVCHAPGLPALLALTAPWDPWRRDGALDSSSAPIQNMGQWALWTAPPRDKSGQEREVRIGVITYGSGDLETCFDCQQRPAPSMPPAPRPTTLRASTQRAPGIGPFQAFLCLSSDPWCLPLVAFSTP